MTCSHLKLVLFMLTPSQYLELVTVLDSHSSTQSSHQELAPPLCNCRVFSKQWNFKTSQVRMKLACENCRVNSAGGRGVIDRTDTQTEWLLPMYGWGEYIAQTRMGTWETCKVMEKALIPVRGMCIPELFQFARANQLMLPRRGCRLV